MTIELSTSNAIEIHFLGLIFHLDIDLDLQASVNNRPLTSLQTPMVRTLVDFSRKDTPLVVSPK